MKITNKLNLPEPFLVFASKSEYGYKEHRYSVTELLLPIREIILTRKHYNELEKDVTDFVPALFGTAVHSVLESSTPLLCQLFSEESVSAEFGSDTVSGRIDLLNMNDLSIEDYKTCSVSKVMKEDFEDWKMQGLMYAYLIYKEKGVIMKHIKFYALMKDWSKIKSAVTSNYPSSAIYVWKYELDDSDYDYIDRWIRLRLELINKYLETNTLPQCTDEECWYTGTKYAVYRSAGDKRAAMVCDTEQEAHDFITNKCNGAGEIEVRKGEYTKCKYYCNCSKVCGKGGQQ